MSMDRIWGIKSVTFGGVTYDKDNGGPLDADWQEIASDLPDRVADEIYPSAILIPEKEMQVSITMRDPVFESLAIGTKSNLVFVFKKNDASVDETVTFSDMVYTGFSGGGQKSVPAQATLTFRYEGDGATTISRS